MKNILVTGGAGYIGSHMVRLLINEGYNPIVIDNFNTTTDANIKSIEKATGKEIKLIKADLRYDFKDVKIDEDIDAVVHFAALKAVGESVAKPLEYYENNVAGTINLLKWMKEKNITKLVFSSTSAAYGSPEKMPVTEDMPTSPESPYGTSKVFVEQIIKDYAKASDLKAVILRYFNVAGCSEDATIGDLDLNAQNIIPRIMLSHLGLSNFELQIFGDDYPTRDGTCIRDYIDVLDLVDAHLKALDFLGKADSDKFNLFNLGTAKGTTVMEIVNAFEKVTGEKLKYTIAPRREGDVSAVYADPTLVKTKLGWTARRSIEDMIASAWKWYGKMKG